MYGKNILGRISRRQAAVNSFREGEMIELRDVRYRYSSSDPAWALEDVNLRIEPGEYVLLCGASGSGKSTLCRLLNGLIPHFYGGQLEGRVTVDGLDTREHSVGELFGRVGMIFQNPTVQLFNHTVERELAYGLESLGLPRDEIACRVRESADLLQTRNHRSIFELQPVLQQGLKQTLSQNLVRAAGQRRAQCRDPRVQH